MEPKPLVHDENDCPTENEILTLCQDPQRKTVYRNGRSEVVLAGNIAIKFGNVSIEEINNQLHAADLLDPAVVRVPKIHRHFTRQDVRYVVMERIYGDKEGNIEQSRTITAVAAIINHLHTFTSELPGPFRSGPCSGPLWSEDERVCFSSKQMLQEYVNSRLRSNRGNFILSDTPLVFTHGDIAPRNLLFTNRSIWVLDWEFAGYFPRSAEIATLRLGAGKKQDELAFFPILEAAVLDKNPLTALEQDQVKCWQELAINHLRFYWPSKEERRYLYKRPRKPVSIEASSD